MKALIWDAEALADMVETRRAGFNESFRAFAIDLNWDAALWRQLVLHGTGAAPLRAYLARHGGPTLDEATVAALGADASARSAALIAAGAAALHPAAAVLLDDARRHRLRQAVVGPATAAELDALLSSGSRAPTPFQIVVPAPRIDAGLIHRARSQLGMDCADCILIAGTTSAAEAARDAGIDARLLSGPPRGASAVARFGAAWP
ncbi:hypothetical protein [Paracoccus endophyticus]|uniref:hypothetical protein n=1 Tax=Paracoccus endophyticus TaxID=2233774 RepID=UPI000DD9B524|nr:hypothetical protein [Paracoccus endophyticus]